MIVALLLFFLAQGYWPFISSMLETEKIDYIVLFFFKHDENGQIKGIFSLIIIFFFYILSNIYLKLRIDLTLARWFRINTIQLFDFEPR